MITKLGKCVVALSVTALTMTAAQSRGATWTPGSNGGDTVTWDTTSQNWSGAPAWTAGTDDAIFATDGDVATVPAATIVVPTNTGTGITFNGSATVNGSGAGSGIGFVNTTSTLTIDVAATEIGTINANFNGSGTAAGDGNKINKIGSGKLVLTGDTVLVGDVNQNLDAGFTVEGGGELEISGELKAASFLQSNRGNFDSAVGSTSSNNTLTVNGVSGSSVYAGSLLVGATRLTASTYAGAFGDNSVYISRPGDSTTPSYIVAGNGKSLVIGGASSNNYVEVSNGAYVRAQQGGGTNTWEIGFAAGADNNQMVITGTDTTVNRNGGISGSAINVGGAGDSNSVEILAGGSLIPRRLTIGNNGGNNNYVLVSGADSFLGQPTADSNQSFAIGSNRAIDGAATTPGTGNYLQIEDGATAVFNSGQNRGYNVGAVDGADDNYILVTGAGSGFTMTQGQPLAIGGAAGNNNNNHTIADSTASGNHMDIFSGATSLQNSVYVMGVDSAVNLGDGSGISEMEVRASTGSVVYSPGVHLFNASARLNMNSGRLIAGAIGPLTSLVSGPGQVDLLGDGYFQTNEATAKEMSSQITGVGDFYKEGTGELQLTSLLNDYTGDTHITDGILEIQNDYLADASDVYLTTGGLFDLNFGATDTINSLFFDNVAQAAGTWGSTISGATFQNDTFFSGTGVLNVISGGGGDPAAATPEPSAVILAFCGLLGFLCSRQKRGHHRI